MSPSLVDGVPPLKGDGKGVYRIRIVGNSGVGKSTLADELGVILGLPVIHLDTLFWNPGWEKTPSEEFREKLKARIRCIKIEARIDGGNEVDLRENECGWIVDGCYEKRLGDMLSCETDIVWLDTPFLLYFPRLCWRTLLRLTRKRPPCAPGCEEMAKEVFLSTNSILWWGITNHRVVKKRWQARFVRDDVRFGGKIRRIGGWGGELMRWKEDVRKIVRGE